jgi:hypothetical protein
MKLGELIDSTAPVTPVPEKQEVNEQDIEKLAEYLDAFAEEDTLLDDLARAAVVADMLEKKNGN